MLSANLAICTYVTTPKRLILTLGFRRAQIYTRLNAKLEDRKGIVTSGEMARRNPATSIRSQM